MNLRILHTSDWHLGQSLHGVERTPEHAAFLAWLLDTLEATRADALLVAGDVFDASNPPASATAQWYRFLAEAWRRMPALHVVAIGGNHDSAARLDAPNPILRAMDRLHVVGGVQRRGGALDLERLVVALPDASGRCAAAVAAVPFLRLCDLPPVEAEDPLRAGVEALYAEVLSAARARLAEGGALLAMGHLYMQGGLVSDLSERKILGGNLHAIPDALFPDDVAYAALGHLHRPQQVGARAHVRYSGSPIPLSFDERDYESQVVLVELDGRRAARVEPLRVPRFRALLRLPEGEPAPLDRVVALLQALPEATGEGDAAGRLPPLVEVRVALERPEPGLGRMVNDALEGRDARLARIAPPRITGHGAPLAEAASDGRALADFTPEEVFRRRWERDHAEPIPSELLEAFHELVAAAEAGGEGA